MIEKDPLEIVAKKSKSQHVETLMDDASWGVNPQRGQQWKRTKDLGLDFLEADCWNHGPTNNYSPSQATKGTGRLLCVLCF